MNDTSRTWISSYPPRPHARLRLFCLPYAGGSSTVFRTWARGLPAEVEVCAVRLPGRESRFHEPMPDSLAVLAEELAGALLPAMDRPYALFGHSMGALVGFELARRLREPAAARLRCLIVSGCAAPQSAPEREQFAHLPDQELLAAISRLNGTPQEVLQHPDLLALALPIIRADFALLEAHQYQAGPPLAHPISAYCGASDPLVRAASVGLWRTQTSHRFTMHVLPGDHFFLHSAQPQLLHLIAGDLEAQTAETG